MTTSVLNTKISEVDNKKRNVTNLVTTTVLNTKIGEVENKIPNVTILAKKQIMRLKYQALNGNTLLLLIIINS